MNKRRKTEYTACSQTFMSEATDELEGEQFDVDALFADIA